MRALREAGISTPAIAAICGTTSGLVRQTIGPRRESARPAIDVERWRFKPQTRVLLPAARLMGRVLGTFAVAGGRLVARVEIEGGDVVMEYAEPGLVEVIGRRA